MNKTEPQAATATLRMEYSYDVDGKRWTQINAQLPAKRLTRMTKVALIELYNETHKALGRSDNKVEDSLKRIANQREEIEGQSKIIAAMVNMALLIPHGKG